MRDIWLTVCPHMRRSPSVKVVREFLVPCKAEAHPPTFGSPCRAFFRPEQATLKPAPVKKIVGTKILIEH